MAGKLEKSASGLFLGLTTVDIFNYVSKYPGSNEKNKARSQLVSAGGPAANAAVAYAAFGNPTHLMTGLGLHPLAGLAVNDLTAHNVKIVDLSENPQQQPVLSSIIIDESTGDRSVVYTDTKDLRILWESDTFPIEQEIGILMLDGYYLPQAIQAAGLAKKSRIPVVLDGGSWKDGIEELLPLVDYAICSANFYPPACTSQNMVVDYLVGEGVDYIAISDGGSAIRGFSPNETRDIPVQQVEVVDTLGAGDILHGAFCHFIKSSDFFTSLESAAEIATISCKFKGTRRWIEAIK